MLLSEDAVASKAGDGPKYWKGNVGKEKRH